MPDLPIATMMTAADLLEMPDDEWQYELVRGTLVRMRASSSIPAIVATNIGDEIKAFVRPRHLGLCAGADWGFLLSTDPDTVRAPDYAFVRADRIPSTGIPPGFWPGAPDLVVEVVSPSDRFSEVMDKAHEYITYSARLVWVVDPMKRFTIVVRPNGSMTRVGADGALDGEDVLSGFTLRLSDVWV